MRLEQEKNTFVGNIAPAVHFQHESNHSLQFLTPQTVEEKFSAPQAAFN